MGGSSVLNPMKKFDPLSYPFSMKILVNCGGWKNNREDL